MATMFNFFPKPVKREFHSKPIYFDPEKDRLEKLKKQYDPHTSEEERLAEAKVRIRESFRRKPAPKGVMGRKVFWIAVLAVIVLLVFVLR